MAHYMGYGQNKAQKQCLLCGMSREISIVPKTMDKSVCSWEIPIFECMVWNHNVHIQAQIMVKQPYWTENISRKIQLWNIHNSNCYQEYWRRQSAILSYCFHKLPRRVHLLLALYFPSEKNQHQLWCDWQQRNTCNNPCWNCWAKGRYFAEDIFTFISFTQECVI